MSNDNALPRFRENLKLSKKQISLDRFFLVRERSSQSQVSSSPTKRQRREITPKKDLPEIFIVWESHSKAPPHHLTYASRQ